MKTPYRSHCQKHGFGCGCTMYFDTEALPNLGSCIRRDLTAPKTLHLAIHVSHLLMIFNLASLNETLGDYGLVHELAHIQQFGPECEPCAASIDSLAALGKKLQQRLSLVAAPAEVVI